MFFKNKKEKGICGDNKTVKTDKMTTNKKMCAPKRKQNKSETNEGGKNVCHK